MSKRKLFQHIQHSYLSVVGGPKQQDISIPKHGYEVQTRRFISECPTTRVQIAPKNKYICSIPPFGDQFPCVPRGWRIKSGPGWSVYGTLSPYRSSFTPRASCRRRRSRGLSLIITSHPQPNGCYYFQSRGWFQRKGDTTEGQVAPNYMASRKTGQKRQKITVLSRECDPVLTEYPTI